MINCTKFTVILFVIAVISGCSQKYTDINATLKEALYGGENVIFDKDEIETLPYASMKVRINDGPYILMVLAFADSTPNSDTIALKWMSADGAMIIMEHGRIIKTLNLYSENLVDVSIETAKENPNSASSHFTAIYDWQPDYTFNQVVSVTSEPQNTALTSSLIWEKELTLIHESLTFSNRDIDVDNYYWLDADKNVLKSSQWLIPNKLHIEYEILKPYQI